MDSDDFNSVFIDMPTRDVSIDDSANILSRIKADTNNLKILQLHS